MEALPSIRARQDRVVHEFSLPAEMVDTDEHVRRSIGLVKLEMSDEISAAERARGNQARLAYSFARMSLWEVDGRQVNKAEGEDETILQRCDPAIRELILLAYADISTAPDGASKKFLASRKVKVG